MKYLIAGLGNVGDEYHNTRHNIGFTILDALAEASGIVFNDKRYGFTTEYRYKGRTLILLKPNTYVNLSGKSVNYWLQKESIPPENLLVLSDDLSLPFGTIRLRARGGDGGHNGLTSIIETLGNQNFARLRFGIGGDFPYGMQVDYVLGKWTKEEASVLPEKLKSCHEVIQGFATLGVERTMNNFNKRL
ncbi:MAG TPA: aminoacyl-tRNA hydrolase [Bacteroidales bacterium]|nr:aminoacyl-tRNA hydrolase [Bacteroidales bacterium]